MWKGLQPWLKSCNHQLCYISNDNGYSIWDIRLEKFGLIEVVGWSSKIPVDLKAKHIFVCWIIRCKDRVRQYVFGGFLSADFWQRHWE